jgi:hypothetical protein
MILSAGNASAVIFQAVSVRCAGPIISENFSKPLLKVKPNMVSVKVMVLIHRRRGCKPHGNRTLYAFCQNNREVVSDKLSQFALNLSDERLV